ncbi:hypothetical protein FRC03_006396, partial [Tulasnella sp. 419]
EHGSTLGNSYGTWDQSKNAPVEKNVNSNSNWDTSTYNQPSSTGGYEKDLRYDDKYYDDPNAYNGDWRFTEHEWEAFVKETRRQNAQKIVDILEWADPKLTQYETKEIIDLISNSDFTYQQKQLLGELFLSYSIHGSLDSWQRFCLNDALWAGR